MLFHLNKSKFYKNIKQFITTTLVSFRTYNKVNDISTTQYTRRPALANTFILNITHCSIYLHIHVYK